MSKWDDDLKAIGDVIDRSYERIEFLDRLSRSRFEQILSGDKRIAELEKQLAEMEERIVKAGLPV